MNKTELIEAVATRSKTTKAQTNRKKEIIRLGVF